MCSWRGEVSLQSELLRHEAGEALGPSVGPGVALLSATNTEAHDPKPGIPHRYHYPLLRKSNIYTSG